MQNINNVREQILPIVLEGIKVINQNLEQPLPLEQLYGCPIYGSANGIDSISLVALISIIEDSVENQLNHSIIIANEKSMSRRNTPFLTVGTLVDYICELIAANSELEGHAV